MTSLSKNFPSAEHQLISPTANMKRHGTLGELYESRAEKIFKNLFLESEQPDEQENPGHSIDQVNTTCLSSSAPSPTFLSDFIISALDDSLFGPMSVLLVNESAFDNNVLPPQPVLHGLTPSEIKDTTKIPETYFVSAASHNVSSFENLSSEPLAALPGLQNLPIDHTATLPSHQNSIVSANQSNVGNSIFSPVYASTPEEVEQEPASKIQPASEPIKKSSQLKNRFVKTSVHPDVSHPTVTCLNFRHNRSPSPILFTPKNNISNKSVRKTTIKKKPIVKPNATQKKDKKNKRNPQQIKQKTDKRKKIKSTERNNDETPAQHPPLYCWEQSEEFVHEVVIPENSFTTPSKLLSPFQYFFNFFDETLIKLIVDNTNLHSTRVIGKSINTSVAELYDFIAIKILMGIIKLPSYRDYWASDFRISAVADIMPLKRYETIRRCLHFCDDTATNNDLEDKYFKIRPVSDYLRKKFLAIEHENRFSIDEIMIPYHGTKAGSKRQCMKNKLKQWGYKIYVRAGVSGIIYDFLIYGGETTFYDRQFTDEENLFGFCGKTVIALCKTIPFQPLKAVFFDNFFSSLSLVEYLRSEYGILSLGTIRSNRLKGCHLLNEKELKKKGRGSFFQMVDNERKLCVVQWMDNKSVVLISSFTSAYPVSKTVRYCKESKKKVEITCPKIVSEYDTHMRGVDSADMLVGVFRTAFRTQRWYMAIFSQLLDMSINNAWLQSRRHKKLLEATKYAENRGDILTYASLKQFRKDIAKGLIQKFKPIARPLVPEPKKTISVALKPRPSADIRYDNTGHFPVSTVKGRCRMCTKGQTTISCSKCDLRLCCFKKRNCFYSFHNTP